LSHDVILFKKTQGTLETLMFNAKFLLRREQRFPLFLV